MSENIQFLNVKNRINNEQVKFKYEMFRQG